MKRGIRSALFATVVSALAARNALAQAPGPGELALPALADRPMPEIDGRIGDAEWALASVIVGGFQDDRYLDGRFFKAYLMTDSTNLYLALHTRTGEDADLRAAVAPEPGKDQIRAFYDDSIELWLAPDTQQGGETAYQVILNSKGARYDAALDVSRSPARRDERFQISWRQANVIRGGDWQAEFALPLAPLGIRPGRPFGLRLVRNYPRQVDWSPVAGPFESLRTMGAVTILDRAPVVRQSPLMSADGSRADIQVELVNPGPRPLELRIATYSQVGDGNPEDVSDGSHALAPGASLRVPVSKTAGFGLFKNRIRVADAAGACVYFDRKFYWDCRLPQPAEAPAVFPLQFAYYPSFRLIRARADVRQRPDRASLTGIRFNVRGAEDGRPIAETRTSEIPAGQAEVALELPDLPDGRYRLRAVLEGVEAGVAVERDFVRRRYAWESNCIGISDEVIPPYTPLRRDGRTLSAVLRSYELGPLGLPDQVVSEGRLLLAGSVRLEAAVDGVTYPLTVRSPLRFSRVEPHEIRYRSEWTAGPLQGSLAGALDYDGMLKLDLRFGLPSNAVLDRLDLIMPLREEAAPLMHAISDSSRRSYADFTPAGTGVVWRSRSLGRNDTPDPDFIVPNLPGYFVPYIWLGNERQGLCWFADNDRDWLFDDSKSPQALVREPGSVALAVSFAKAPGPLRREHHIVFGLQATPTKPLPDRPDAWRRIVFSLPAPSFSNLLNVTILGSTLQWGGGGFFDVYPRGRDLSLYRLIRATRDGAAPDAEWSAWLDGYDRDNPSYELVLRNMKAGLWHIKSRPDILIPYTDARGVPSTAEEFETFQDEWLIYPYSTRRWPRYEDGSQGYTASLAGSRRNFILHYYREMLTSGAFDSIYFDCTYLKAVRDPVCTSAYRDDNGGLRAGCELFALRELFKRCAVLTHQQRGYNLNVAHMTGALAAPLMTWFGVILDWESRYGMQDFQDRFSRGYIRAISTGGQVGCVPLTCGSIGVRGEPRNERPRVLRSLAASLLAHELRDWAVGWEGDTTYADALRALVAFGYGRDDCRVFNYWQDGYPAVLRGPDTASLLLARGGEALAVVADYGGGGPCRLEPDAAALGLTPGGRWIDAASGAALPGDGAACVFDLARHDFVLLHYR